MSVIKAQSHSKTTPLRICNGGVALDATSIFPEGVFLKGPTDPVASELGIKIEIAC